MGWLSPSCHPSSSERCTRAGAASLAEPPGSGGEQGQDDGEAGQAAHHSSGAGTDDGPRDGRAARSTQHRPARPAPELLRSRAWGGGQQQGPAWRFSSARSVKGTGQPGIDAHAARSSHPASTAVTRAARIVVRSAIRPRDEAGPQSFRGDARQAGDRRLRQCRGGRSTRSAQHRRMRQLPLVEQAMGRQTTALLRQLEATCTSADDLAQATVESFNTHPDAEIITSFPGLGSLTGTRVLAEIGDPIPLHRRQRPQSLRRDRTGHPGVRKKRRRPRPPGQEPTPGLRRLRLGLLRPDRLTWRPSPLRPTTQDQRPPHRRPAQPLQPTTRMPPPLPDP